MALPGRKPKPTHLKVLEGNPGKRAINKAEPKPGPGFPPCPKHLSPVAKRTWSWVRRHQPPGVITSADRDVLAAYCEGVAHHQQACELIEAEGPVVEGRDGGMVRNPAMQAVRDSAMIIRSMAAELGLTPSARTRFSVQEPEEGDGVLS